jgi:hypothetical protein
LKRIGTCYDVFDANIMSGRVSWKDVIFVVFFEFCFLCYIAFFLLFCHLYRSEHGLVGAPREVIITWRHSVEYEWVSRLSPKEGHKETYLKFIKLRLSFSYRINYFFQFSKIITIVFQREILMSVFYFLHFVIFVLKIKVSFSGVDIIFLNRRHVFVPLSYVSVEITCFSNLKILMALKIKQCPLFLISLPSGHNTYGPQVPEMRFLTEYFSV